MGVALIHAGKLTLLRDPKRKLSWNTIELRNSLKERIFYKKIPGGWEKAHIYL